MAGFTTLTNVSAELPDAIVVFAHGSRDPLWKLPVEAVAARIAAKVPQTLVRCAYLELTAPDLDFVVNQVSQELNAIDSIAPKHRGYWTMRVFPLFFGVGRHAREDLPALVAQCRAKFPHLHITLSPSAGECDGVLEAAAAAALG